MASLEIMDPLWTHGDVEYDSQNSPTVRPVCIETMDASDTPTKFPAQPKLRPLLTMDFRLQCAVLADLAHMIRAQA